MDTEKSLSNTVREMLISPIKLERLAFLNTEDALICFCKSQLFLISIKKSYNSQFLMNCREDNFKHM